MPVGASLDQPLADELDLDEIYEGSSLLWISHGLGRSIVPEKVWNLLSHRDFENRSSEPLPQQIIAGPAVKWAYLSNLNLWAFFAWFTYLARRTSFCNDSGSEGYATYPSWLSGVFLVILLLSMYFEVRCLGYVLVPQLQVTKSFKFLCLDFTLFPFVIWFSFMMFMSVFSHLDFATNALFTATTLKTVNVCPQGSAIEEVWSTVLSQALVYGDPSFARLINIAWWLMFFQIIFAVCDAVPLFPCAVDYCVGYGPGYTFRYRTLFHGDQNHGAALVTLQNASRMASNVFQAEAFAIGRFIEVLDSRGMHWETRCLHHLRGSLNRGILTFGLIGIGESAFYLNLQISLAAVNCAVTGKSFFAQWQICLSVIVSLLMAVKRTYDATHLISTIMNARERFKDALKSTTSDMLVLEEALNKQRAQNGWRLRLLIILFTIYCGAVIYALLKFVAIAVCPHSVWNLSGCVELDSKYAPSKGGPRTIKLAMGFAGVCISILVLVVSSIWARFLCCKSDDSVREMKQKFGQLVGGEAKQEGNR